MSVEIPTRDGDGYLEDMSAWTMDIAKAMADTDDITVSDEQWQQILRAREYFEDQGTVPAIRKFAKYIGINQKILFKQWMTGPMKPITKYGGLPKPTGCV